MATGKVYLVGAGPGDPGLLTLKGLECLWRADLVLYDGLVNPLLLRHTPATAERTARTGGPGGKHLNQDEINERLVEAALSGRTVVRLKGGDPFIFGRGSEEAAALRAAGIPFEVVPGITAATAASEYAGISLTHRQTASAVAYVTGHEDPLKSQHALDYSALARFPGTLVFYMGLDRLEGIVGALLEQGKPASTPVCVISRATTPAQRCVSAPLEGIAKAAAAAALTAPSLIVVGECVKQRETLQWFEDKPLFGLRIVLTRPEHQVQDQIDRAVRLGAQPIVCPLIDVHPEVQSDSLAQAIERLPDYDWIVFSSPNGVTSFFAGLQTSPFDVRRLGGLRLAVVGQSTASALQNYGLNADVIPSEFHADALADALAEEAVSGKRFLWLRGDRARPNLADRLRAAGGELDEVIVYRTADSASLGDVAPALDAGELDWVTLSSPAAARNLARLISPRGQEHLGRTIRIAAISPVTADAANEAGLPVSAVARVHTWDGLFDSIIAASGGVDSASETDGTTVD